MPHSVQRKFVLSVAACVALCGCSDAASDEAANGAGRVRALFDLGSPASGPFPSDRFTVSLGSLLQAKQPSRGIAGLVLMLPLPAILAGR
jgi:hypothetical protein